MPAISEQPSGTEPFESFTFSGRTVIWNASSTPPGSGASSRWPSPSRISSTPARRSSTRSASRFEMPMNPATNAVAGMLVQLARLRHLLDHAARS